MSERIAEKTSEIYTQETAVRFPYNSDFPDRPEAPQSLPVQKQKIKKIGLSNSDIVPDEIQVVLISLRDKIRTSCFAIGDVANLLVHKSAERGLPITQQRVFDAVGSYCGKSGRTVRYYAETAAFYEDDIRDEYDILPFAFFVYARSFGSPKCFDVLDFSMERPNITLDALRTHFTTVVPDRIPTGGSEGTIGDYPRIEARDFRISVFISNVSSLIESIEKLLDELDLPDDVRKNVMCGISTIRESMPDIMKATGYRT